MTFTTCIHSYENAAQQALALADLVCADLQRVIKKTRNASLALPGGSTPVLLMQQLAQLPIDWQRVRITLTDERQVSSTHADSNAKLLANNLLSRLPEPPLFVPLYDETQPSEQAHAHCLAQLRTMLPLDVCVLGMGEDGHFASLFPGADRLAEGMDMQNTHAPLLAIKAPNIAQARVSLRLPTILAAPSLHLLIKGTKKTRSH